LVPLQLVKLELELSLIFGIDSRTRTGFPGLFICATANEVYEKNN
jgi:hypothetical protein